MSDTTISSAAFADTKPHYELLDGLRGVAALLVVFYHIFEGLSFAAGGTPITTINHGYLAVDFFFILSGFVIGYAYDDRLGKTMTTGNFFKRRLIRLHPMIIMGVILGAKKSDQLGPLSGNISPLPRTSYLAPGRAGMKNIAQSVDSITAEIAALFRIYRQHPLRGFHSPPFH